MWIRNIQAQIHQVDSERNISNYLQVRNYELDRADGSCQRDGQCEHAKCLQEPILDAAFWDLLRRNVHLDWKVHSERPEAKGPDEADEVIEERQDDGLHTQGTAHGTIGHHYRSLLYVC